MYGDFIYDSSVVLAQVFSNSRFQSRVKKIQKDTQRLNIPCHVTPAVVKECNRKVNHIGKYIVTTVRNLSRNISYQKDPSAATQSFQLTESDLQLFMGYFANAASALARTQGSQTEKEALEYIETWIVETFEDKVSKTKSVDSTTFFAKCVIQATNMHSNWIANLSKHTSNLVNSSVSQATFQTLRGRLAPIPNEDDIRVLVEAAEYLKTEKKLVFVALDYKEIIRFSGLIGSVLGLAVADPLYALTTLRRLT